MIRHQGLKTLKPLVDLNESSWSQNAKEQLKVLRPKYRRIADGMSSQKPSESLEGFERPQQPPEDPLAIVAREKEALQKRKREKRRQELEKFRIQSTK
jgi:hypothetical protein